MTKEKFIVLDVEGQSVCRPYNVGYIIADRYGKIYKRHSFALPECFWENIKSAVETGICLDMAKKNIQEILADGQHKKRNRKYKSISINEFYNLLVKEIKRYKIRRLFAYNVTFDKSALNRLFGERFEDLVLEYCDIVTGILYTKLLTKKYITFCKENGYITEKGNIQYKAEIVYRYLMGDFEFIEEHTGLADTLNEYEILLFVFRSHKMAKFEPCQAWRVLKNFCNEKDIEI